MRSVVGLLHPGEMGAAIGAVLREQGVSVLWASRGRSADTADRASQAGLEDAGDLAELARRSDVILSICPPHAALDVGRAVADFDGIFVDANAVSPGTARTIAGAMRARFVDGGIVGPPPTSTSTRLYVSGGDSPAVRELFEGSRVDARIVSDRVGDASAVKMTYAAWTKGTAALLLALREVARAEGIDETLVAEWRESLPELPERWEAAARSARRKGWRWIAEMEEIASTFAAAGQPDGFHRAAAEVFRGAR